MALQFPPTKLQETGRSVSLEDLKNQNLSSGQLSPPKTYSDLLLSPYTPPTSRFSTDDLTSSFTGQTVCTSASDPCHLPGGSQGPSPLPSCLLSLSLNWVLPTGLQTPPSGSHILNLSWMHFSRHSLPCRAPSCTGALQRVGRV